MSAYQPKTGAKCSCRRGQERDNCPQCEGTGMCIDFAAIRAKPLAPKVHKFTQEYDGALVCDGVVILQPCEGFSAAAIKQIVHRNNTHDELLAALLQLAQNVNTDLHGYWTESTANYMQQAEQAIARAKGGAS